MNTLRATSYNLDVDVSASETISIKDQITIEFSIKKGVDIGLNSASFKVNALRQETREKIALDWLAMSQLQTALVHITAYKPIKFYVTSRRLIFF